LLESATRRPASPSRAATSATRELHDNLVIPAQAGIHSSTSQMRISGFRRSPGRKLGAHNGWPSDRTSTDRPAAAPLGRGGRGAGRRRDGGKRRRPDLPGRVRAARARRPPGDDARHGVSHCLDDQGGHLGRGDAARRRGQARARCAGARYRPGAEPAAGARRLRRLRRRDPPACQTPDHVASSADPHRRLRL
jgi:hypothetical protein